MVPDILDNALQAAKGLLGYKLVHTCSDGVTTAIIVETEAYMPNDPASHTFRGKTPRNSVMFGPPGHAYVYFTYGMHYCFNVVTGKIGQGQGVLIRALEPISGIDLMKKRRGVPDRANLTNGPAKLVQAMGITKSDYGANLFNSGKLRLEPSYKPKEITETVRVGIKQAAEYPWRFYITGNSFISKT